MSKDLKQYKTNQNIDETLEDLLQAVHAGFSEVTDQLANMVTKDEFNQRFDQVEGRVSKIEATMVTKDDLKHELEPFATKDDLKQALAEQETRLVTKDYLDEKLYDLRGDLTVSLRKEDEKVVKLVSILEERQVLSKQDANTVLAMDLFPHRS